MKIVVDAGPVIALAKAGQLSILTQLYDHVVLPAQVLKEVARPGETRPGIEIASGPFVAVKRVNAATRRKFQQAHDLDAGESEAILLAQADPDGTALLLDERRGRRVAASLGLRTLRTGALLVGATQQGLLSFHAVKAALEHLRQESYLSEKALQDIQALLLATKPVL